MTLDPARTAIFLDFDGTLAEIVEDPTKASCPPQVLACLQNLYSACGGALAVVSGRAIAQLDDFLGPARLPLAGIHGLQRRTADGRVETPVIDATAV
ncbi:MAG: trehalose-phosphatase, partial [Rhizobiaceae bacterium]